jgi:tetratricopeptide (TPR) repeat protein
LQTARSMAPGDPRVLVAEGDVNVALGNHAAAMSAYDGALSRYGADVPPNEKCKITAKKAVAMYKSGDVAGSKSVVETQLRTQCPQFVAFVTSQTQGVAMKSLAVANGYIKANMLDEAMENINKAIEAGDRNAIAFKMQGLVYMKKGQLQQAVMAFQKAAEAETDPAKKAALYKIMVKAQFSGQMYREVATTADLILQTNQEPVTRGQILLMKAQALYQLGQYQQAIEAAKAGLAVVSTPPQQAVYHFVIAMSAKKAGDVNAAREAFTAAMGGSAFRIAAKTELSALGGPLNAAPGRQ